MHEIDRTRRVSELIRRELSSLIVREVNDPRVKKVTITAVTIGRDLKQATVYFTFVDSDISAAETEKVLNNASKYLRYQLGQHTHLRSTPGLLFKYDDTIDRGVALTNLIDSLNRKDGEN